VKIAFPFYLLRQLNGLTMIQTLKPPEKVVSRESPLFLLSPVASQLPTICAFLDKGVGHNYNLFVRLEFCNALGRDPLSVLN
jgi:hypothetical protein